MNPEWRALIYVSKVEESAADNNSSFLPFFCFSSLTINLMGWFWLSDTQINRRMQLRDVDLVPNCHARIILYIDVPDLIGVNISETADQFSGWKCLANARGHRSETAFQSHSSQKQFAEEHLWTCSLQIWRNCVMLSGQHEPKSLRNIFSSFGESVCQSSVAWKIKAVLKAKGGPTQY